MRPTALARGLAPALHAPFGMPRVTRAALIGVAIVVISSAAAWWWLGQGPTAEDFAGLQSPRITRLPDERMLVVDVAGDPNVVGGSAFKALFSAYYGLNGVSRMSRPPAPRARWPHPADTPKAQWLGRYALPLPTGSTAASAPAGSTGAHVDTWTYGEVAELLHVGPYSAEQPDIERLQAFVVARGYRVIGEHEEEYVRGPGMILAGDPAKYLTILRLRVAPAGTAP